MSDSDNAVAGPSANKKLKYGKRHLAEDELLNEFKESDSNFEFVPCDFDSYIKEEYDSDQDDDNPWVVNQTTNLDNLDIDWQVYPTSLRSLKEFEDSDQDQDDDDPWVVNLTTNLDNADIDWQMDPASMRSFPFIQNEGLLVPHPGDNPMDYFRLLLTNEFLQEVVDQTNIYSQEIFLSEGVKETSRITFWKDLTVDELLIFLGLFLHMGNIRTNRLQDYWKKDPLFHNSGIAMNMSRNRFLIILRTLHFSKNPEEGDAKLADSLFKIRPIVDYFNKKMTEVFSPGRELLLDESLVLWPDRLAFRQCIKNGKHKYGIKLYILTNPSGLILKFAVYSGVLDDFCDKGYPERVVLNLLDKNLNVGHHVYMSKFYNSFDLAKKLLDLKTHCTGIFKIGRQNCPKEVKCAKLKKGETVARYASGVMIAKWRDKRDVCYISNEYKNHFQDTENKIKEIVSKPVAIINYNKYMSGIDRQDQLMLSYLSERKTIRWSRKLFIHIVEMIVVNSHHLFNKYSGKKLTLYEFRLNIIKGLLPQTSEQVTSRKKSSAAAVHTLTKREETSNNKILRKRCKSCTKNGKRTDTIYECKICPEKPGFCLNCSVIVHK